MRFADGSFIDKAECILITGSTGIGKKKKTGADQKNEKQMDKFEITCNDLGYRTILIVAT